MKRCEIFDCNWPAEYIFKNNGKKCCRYHKKEIEAVHENTQTDVEFEKIED